MTITNFAFRWKPQRLSWKQSPVTARPIKEIAEAPLGAEPEIIDLQRIYQTKEGSIVAGR